MTAQPKKAEWIRKAVAAGGEFHSMKQVPWRHNLINLSSAAVLWTCILGVLAWGSVANPLVYVPVAAVLVGCMFFAHYILVIHECSHNMFLVFKDRKRQKSVNRWIGIVSAGAFFTDYVLHWEKGHTIHHLRPCEDDDPQDKHPLTGPDLYKHYAGLAFIPLYFMKINPSNQYGFSLKRFLGGLAAWVPALALTGFFISPWAPLVLLLSMHVLMALNMTKKAQEHGCGLKDEVFPELRSRTYLYPLSFMMSPFNINFHFEHHANFNVPWYLLPAYHEKLKSIVPGELYPYIFHHEWFQQLSGKKDLIPDELRPLTFAEPAAEAS